MKIFKPKSITGKFIIAMVAVIMIFNFVFPQNVSHAGIWGDITGSIISAFLDLFLLIGDIANRLIQGVVLGTNEIFVNVGFGSGGAWFWAIVAALAVIAVVALIVATGGLAAAPLGAAITFFIKAAVTVVVIGGITYHVAKGKLPDNVDLPVFQATPQEIFSNKLPLLDVNFFKPMYGDAEEITRDNYLSVVQVPGMNDEDKDKFVGKWYVSKDGNYGYNGLTYNSDNTLADNSDLLIDRSPAVILREQISSWYNVLRTIALLGLLTVLLYVGIRILMCSVASEKAKYKSMMGNWLTAMCLLFVLHYIMAFSVSVVSKISETISVSFTPHKIVIQNSGDKNIVQKAWEQRDKLRELGYPQEEVFSGDPNNGQTGEDAPFIIWKTNLTGAARLNAQLGEPEWKVKEDGTVEETDKTDEQNTVYRKGAYTVVYLALTFLTMFFLVQYLKRLIVIAFLTLMAPLITLTYPIDKIGDGKAQAFDYWLKEYMFNLLLQPFHLILYFVFIGSAMEFASQNVLYTIVALGFMMPAEKILRKMFGFDKSDTAKKMSGAAAGAMAMAGFQKLARLGNGGKRASGGKGGSGGSGGSGGDNGMPEGMPPVGITKANSNPLGEGTQETPEQRIDRRQELKDMRDMSNRELEKDNLTLDETKTWEKEQFDANRQLKQMDKEDKKAEKEEEKRLKRGQKDAEVAWRRMERRESWEKFKNKKPIVKARGYGNKIGKSGTARFTRNVARTLGRGGKNIAAFAKRHPELGRFGKGAGKVLFKGATGVVKQLPNAARFGVRAVGTVAGAGIGGIIAVASGHSEKAVQYMGLGGLGVGTLTSKAESVVDVPASGISKASLAVGASYVQGAYGKNSEQANNYAAYLMSHSPTFKQPALEVSSVDMSKGQKKQHIYDMAKLSVKLDMGRDGNKADMKSLNKLAEYQRNLLNTGTKPKIAQKQTEQVADLAKKIKSENLKNVKEMEKEIPQKLADAMAKEIKKLDPKASSSEIDTKSKIAADSIWETTKDVAGKKI